MDEEAMVEPTFIGYRELETTPTLLVEVAAVAVALCLLQNVQRLPCNLLSLCPLNEVEQLHMAWMSETSM